MRYLLAILLPPVAVFLCGKPMVGILNIILTLCFWVPGVVHALFVVHSHLNEKQTQKIVDAINNKG
ncbi:YqaE/Pmp3 family membrane protein [Dasania sp. GY-MA-18]|uniref:YqaE/Pmp3 family membrane protein n=1 Tax=Dasania phycosphaerae TaxID=2950436 RepID=A0A9J6RHB8_9GAMM|nr:YqaE/Pmp3 family membrane protein [Dasania sp. GY-MA-18]MCZ0863852.1 YqaE/Pmp3 family membrane protein [Dasania phycosphaerae]MCZ0867580.1 YqaE/Pmp3 family membrane protein [Dasania phycosphaerae]